MTRVKNQTRTFTRSFRETAAARSPVPTLISSSVLLLGEERLVRYYGYNINIIMSLEFIY